MKLLKILLISIAVLFVLLLAAAIILPRVYKPQLLEAIKEQANENLDATLDFEDLHVSLFRQFPLLTLSLQGLSIEGKDAFEGVTLLQCKEANISLSVMDLLKKDAPLIIRQFHLQDPNLHVRILEDGRANYDITLATEELPAESAPSTELQGAIRDYSIRNGHLRYEDRSSSVMATVAGLNHRGKGDFSAARFDLDTRTTIDSLYARMDGITYLNQARLDLQAILGVDMDAMRFTLKDNQLQLNDLLLKAEGYVALLDEDIDMDLRFTAPDNQIRSLWSMVPGAYTADFAQLESRGTFDLSGWIKGVYGEQRFPAFEVKSRIADGYIKYPDLPEAIDQIQLQMRIHQPGDRLEMTEVEIPSFAFRVGDQPLKGHFYLKDPMDDPDVSAAVVGRLDLASLSKAFPLEGAKLDGIIDADVHIQARMSALDRQDYDAVDLRGEASFNKVAYRTADQPDLMVNTGKLTFSPQAVTASAFEVMAGRSDLLINARLENILAWFHPERTLKGKMDLRGRLLDLDEWSGEGSATAPAPDPEQEDLQLGMPVEQYDLALDARFDQVRSAGMVLRDLRIEGMAGPVSIQAKEISGKIKNSDFRLDGQFENLIAWMTGDAVLRGVVNFYAKNLVVADFVDDDPSAQDQPETPASVVAIPADVQLVAHARVDRLVYDQLEMRNLRGTANVGQQVLLLQDVQADGLGGKIKFEGNYNTRDITQPAFHFKYDMERIDFAQVHRQLPSMQRLAPVLEYLQGRFSTSLVMDGILGPDMRPLLNTLDAAGFLETFSAVLKNFKPLEGLADKLNIAELRTMDLKNSRNWFEIEDGNVELKDFDYRYKDIDMVIGGRHGLAQDMAYNVRMRIPRKYLDKTGITAQANTGLRWLEAEAAQRGLNVGLGEFVNVAILIGGRLQQPTYSLRVLGTEGKDGTSLEQQVGQQLSDAADRVRDTIQDIAQQRIDQAKEQVRKEAEQRIDTLKRQAEAAIDSALIKAQQEAARKLGEEAAKKAEELGGDKAKDEADKIKEKLKKWNPLGGKRE